jgi:hypothetical protein
MKAEMKETLKSVAIKVTALLAFLAINMIGYRAFSQETPIATSTKQVTTTAAVPSCQLASEGYVENKWKNIRIQVGGAIVAGAETLSDLSHQLKQLVVEHKCLPLPVPCSFASEGLAVGAWAQHRILVQDIIAFGGDTTARLFEQFGELKKIGVCE